MTSLSLRDAETMLLERRRAQRGTHTLGDDADRALLTSLAALPATASADARATGRLLGEHVYSRRFLDDDLAGAVKTLAHAIHASGAGSLAVADAFHRSVTVRYEPSGPLAPADRLVALGFFSGVLEGYLGHAFNCAAEVQPTANGIHVRLGEGRDVNAASRGRAG